MWRNPNHPQPESPAPPGPSGRLLANFERPGRGRGPETELRVDLDEYEGHAYVSLRVWTRGPDDGWYPTRKGCSVRLSEADEVAAALVEGARLASLPPARLPGKAPAGATPRGRPGRGGRPASAGAPAASSPHDPDFDEFGA